MIINVQKVGNSKGIILPKQLIAMCGIEEQVNIVVEDNNIVISAAHKPRSDWDEKFMAAGKDNVDNDFSEGLPNKFDKDEWTW